MKAIDVNEKALSLLDEQRWSEAQALFFENAKKNPSHETYNNLGWYLISEGLTCKNGSVRNARKLGLKYLLKAFEMKKSSVNLCALAEANQYAIRGADKQKKQELYLQSYQYLDQAQRMDCSSELLYNFLRLAFLLEMEDESFLKNLRSVVKNLPCEETVSLYYEYLRKNDLLDEGLQCIKTYGELLDEVDLLMFYAKFGIYDRGYDLCETIRQSFVIDKYLASAIIECYINTGHFEEARIFAKETAAKSKQRDNWTSDVFADLDKSIPYRHTLISDYSPTPLYLQRCCYYGCTQHGTPWN